ncbi:MAG: hypothetical protein ACYCSG_02225 [Thermoplasmataceae archaeon]
MARSQEMTTRIRELQAGKNILLLLKVFILAIIILFLIYSNLGSSAFNNINEFLLIPLIIVFIIYRFYYKGKLMLFMQGSLDKNDADSKYIKKYMESLNRSSINTLSLNHLINLLNHFSISSS